MWGEGASDLWGRLELEEDERETRLLEAVRERLRGVGSPESDDGEPEASLAAFRAA